MRKQEIATAFFVAAIICTALVLYERYLSNQSPKQAYEPLSALQSAPSTLGARPDLTNGMTQEEDAYANWFFNEVRHNPDIEWKIPIDFWGKVLNEKDEPVEKVHVHFVWNDLSRAGTSERDTETDAKGRFSLLDQKGKGMTVKVAKAGYYQIEDESIKDFEYASPGYRFHPDPNNPVVFRLKKIGNPVALILGYRFEDFRTNQSGRGFDIYDSKWVPPEEGDIVILFNRMPENERILGKASWDVTLRVPNGGIQEYADPLEFEAPETGYKSELSYQEDMNDPHFKFELQKRFFLKLRNNTNYGRIQVVLFGLWNDTSAARVRSWVNPTGSRNLEFDPKLQPLPFRWDQ